MAKIKFGMVVTDARGKLGGQVFSKNRSGAYVRTKVTPVNPATAAQTSVRSSFGAISQAWSALTEAQRIGFNDAVQNWATTDIFGDLKNPTGKNLFLRLNQQLVQSGQAQITDAPAKKEMVEGIITSVAVLTVSVEIEPDNIYSGADANVMVFATPKLTAGTTFVKNKLRLIHTSLASTLDPTNVWDDYVTKFGLPVVGDNIYFGFKYVLDNGQASPMQVLKGTISAT